MPPGQPSRSPSQPFIVVDLFCGAGGSTSGVSEACAELGIEFTLICVNHWQTAIESHQANHPNATHLCTPVEAIDPRTLIPGGHINLLWASPECTHFSVARGGRPMNDQSRASAWHILRWAELVTIDAICIENVQEFQTWGPLGANGRPLKSKQGTTFHALLNALRSLHYTVDFKVLRAADFGDPTTRERLFILARRGNKRIVWPTPSHSREGGTDLFGTTARWRSAREIIDWSIQGESIFRRKRPLAPSTMRRIEAGLKKFSPQFAEAFLVVLRNHAAAQSLDDPMPTLCANGQHFALAEPFLVPLRKGQAPRSTHEPVPPLTTSEQMALCEPFVLQQQSGGVARSVNQPLPTVATKGAISLVQPIMAPPPSTPLEAFLVHTNHPHHGPKTVEDPIGTVTAQSSNIGLCEPFLVAYHGEHAGAEAEHARVHSVNDPIPTVDCANRFGLAEPFLISLNHPDRVPHSTEEPIQTITGSSADFGLVEAVAVAQSPPDPADTPSVPPDTSPAPNPDPPRAHAHTIPLPSPRPAATTPGSAAPDPYLVKYYSAGPGVQPLSDPLDTITTKDRFALVQPFLTSIDQQSSKSSAVRSIDEPTPTITTKARLAVCQPFLLPFFGERPGQDPRVHSIEQPLPTVTSQGAGALVTPYLLPLNHGKQDTRTHSIDQPIPTITGVQSLGLIEPVLRASPSDHPPDAPTLFRVDVLFRMLQPHELAAAMSFPKGYIFKGTRANRVKLIGNAVPKETAKALTKALIGPRLLPTQAEPAPLADPTTPVASRCSPPRPGSSLLPNVTLVPHDAANPPATARGTCTSHTAPRVARITPPASPRQRTRSPASRAA